jgi:hypothetical protein
MGRASIQHDDRRGDRALRYGCVHHRVTWDPRRPHGCVEFSIKSRRLPCLAVYEASGARCRAYRPKGK